MTDYYDYNEDINYKIAVLERKKLEVSMAEQFSVAPITNTLDFR